MIKLSRISVVSLISFSQITTNLPDTSWTLNSCVISVGILERISGV